MDDNFITKIAIACILIGIILLFFTLDYDIDDGFFEIENDYVYLDGVVVRATQNSADIMSCRNITVFATGLELNDKVIITGNMFNGRINVNNIKKIN
ncbi:MAG: hypothetical protein ACMXX9_03015 [Candidatus Woesearchaeota archaeon]